MSEINRPIRTRFAPSPTGFMHVGGVRTALFAWFVARQAGGQFILRIEDTDQKREVEGSADHLIRSLKALGLTYDEGPEIGGPHAPYFQSERLEIYRAWAQKLIDAGRAYADPYTPAQLDEFREQAKLEKKAFLYRDHRPENPAAWDGTTPLRFKSEPKSYEWHDEVYGDLHSGPEVVDDFILIKSDGFPTYNFAHIVDDAEMEVSHIIRGQEFLASMPNYLNLYEALEIEHPIFATMPHILAPSGNKKLSKRDGAKDVLGYLGEGYLQEALINFIASLGWNDGTEQEVFSVSELIEKFSLDRVGRSGARFDEQRLLWLNGQWIRRLDLDNLYVRSTDFWPASAAEASDDHKKQVLSLVKDRLKTLGDLQTSTGYFFAAPEPNWQMVADNKQLSKVSFDDLKNLLRQAADALQASDFTPEALQTTLDQLLQTTGQKPGILFSMIRLAVSWAPFSPSLNETLAAIGKQATLERLQTAINS
jgi:glutamyl-tRNA synthetase